jgi:hypothetical protein
MLVILSVPRHYKNKERVHGFCGRNALNQRFLKTRRAGWVVFCATHESHLQIALSQTDKK